MLEGMPVVFLSCSEAFRTRVAVPSRDALGDQGIKAVIVSMEPLLPRTPSDPDSKVNAYLDASDALVALCTPDDHLDDGTGQCRQNVIDELQRAQSRPGLGQRVLVLKAPAVRLPSNINPTYNELDIDRPLGSLETMLTQLRKWGILAREPVPAPAASTEPTSVGDMIDGIGLGDHETAARRAFATLQGETRASQDATVKRLVRFLLETDSAGSDVVQRVGSVLEAIARLDPSLVSNEVVEELAASADFTKRSTAAVLLWDRAVVAPDAVPLGLLGRLAQPATEDWYVQAPAMAAAKQLLLHRPAASIVFDSLAASEDADDRYAVAEALLDVARVELAVVPREVAARLAGDRHAFVAAKGRELVSALSALSDDMRDPRSPFGL